MAVFGVTAAGQQRRAMSVNDESRWLLEVHSVIVRVTAAVSRPALYQLITIHAGRS